MTSPRLRAFRSDLRRAIAARRRWLAAIFAAVAVLSAISAARPPPPPTAPVVVARHDLRSGSVLEADDLSTVAWQRDRLPTGVLDDEQQAVGQTVAAPVRAGEPITDVRLVQRQLLTGYPPGTVLATARIADPAAAVIVQAGDLVDIVGADPQAHVPASVLARGVRVVSILESPADALTVGEGLVLVVAVDQATALRLADAAVRQQLSVLLT